LNAVGKLFKTALLVLPIILLLATTNVSYATTHCYNDGYGAYSSVYVEAVMYAPGSGEALGSAYIRSNSPQRYMYAVYTFWVDWELDYQVVIRLQRGQSYNVTHKPPSGTYYISIAVSVETRFTSPSGPVDASAFVEAMYGSNYCII